MDKCKLCSSGKYNMITASTSCKQCAAGRETQETGATDCIPCPVGTKKVDATEVGGQYSCMICIKGSRASQQGADSCDICDPGFYQDTDKQSLCKACPAGKWSETSGAISEAQCRNCVAGKYVNAEASSSVDSCVDCPPGKKAIESGATEDSVCTDCMAGLFSIGGKEQCTSCPKGYVQPDGASATCFKCGSGAIARNNGIDCDNCLEGTFREGGDDEKLSECTSCPRGWSQNVQQQAACLPCVPGKYADGVGQHQCDKCLVGKHSSTAKSASCSDCVLGKNTGPSEWTLTLKTAQAITEDARTKVTQGSVTGTLKTALQNEWTLDIVGQDIGEQRAGTKITQQSEITQQSVTGILKTTIEGETTMILILTASDVSFVDNANVVIGSATVLADNINSATNNGLSTSMVIRATASILFFSNANILIGSTTVTKTNIDSFTNTHIPEGAVHCLLCAGGRYGTPCTDCALGQYRSGKTSKTAESCNKCPRGWYANKGGQSNCLPCVPGSHQMNKGKIQCPFCPQGWFADTIKSSTCTLCPIGQNADRTGSATCQRCIAGKYGDGCMWCKAGQFRTGDDLESTKCTLCPQGWSQEGAGRATCVPCDPGKHQNVTGSSRCDDCSAGTYTGQSMTDMCRKCLSGRTSVPGSVECSSCQTGQQRVKYMSIDEDDYACVNCDPGLWAQAGDQDCTDCAPGFYQPQEATASCVACAPGRYTSVTGADTPDACLNCQPGYYSPAFGASSNNACGQCPPGKFSNISGASTASVCVDCVVGSYATSASIECIECSTGTYTIGASAGSCIVCAPGRYGDKDIESNGCINCPIGWKRSEEDTNLEKCVQCQLGEMSQSGASSCDTCDVGTHGDKDKHGECLKCKPGKYQDARGESICLVCQSGKYANGNQTACEPPVWKLPHDCVKDTEYLDDSSSDKMDWQCIRKCKSIGAQCGVLSSLYANETEKLSTRLIPKPGYWKIPSTLNPDIRQPFVECKYKEDCLWNATSNTTCRNHTKGPLCATCVVGYDRIASYCEQCRTLEVPFRLGLVLLFLVLLFCLLHMCRKRIQSLHAKYGAAWRDIALVIKIMITFTQISLSLPWMLGDFRFPDLYIKFLNRLSMVNINFLDLIGIQCVVDMDYRYGVFMAFGIPFLVVLTCWIAYQCGKCSVLEHDKALTEDERKHIMQTVFRIADFDESGEIDEMEFQHLLHHMTRKRDRPTPKQVQEVMMLAGGRKIKVENNTEQSNKEGPKYHILLPRDNFMAAVSKKRRDVKDGAGGGRGRGGVGVRGSILNVIQAANMSTTGTTLQHLHISDVISDKRAYQWTKLHELAATWLSGAIQLLLVFHAPVSARAFYYFDCHKLGDRYFLRQDYQIECLSSEWNAFLPFALCLLFGFALAMPAGLGLILCRNRERLHTPDVRQRIGFLYNRFVPGTRVLH